MARVFAISPITHKIRANCCSCRYSGKLSMYFWHITCDRIERQTIANWMIYGAEKWLSPLYEAMKAYLLRQEILARCLPEYISAVKEPKAVMVPIEDFELVAFAITEDKQTRRKRTEAEAFLNEGG